MKGLICNNGDDDALPMILVFFTVSPYKKTFQVGIKYANSSSVNI